MWYVVSFVIYGGLAIYCLYYLREQRKKKKKKSSRNGATPETLGAAPQSKGEEMRKT